MHNRYVTLTNALSKKLEDHAHSGALTMDYYNFVRIHTTLRVTPSMAVSVTDRPWEVADIVTLVDAAETKPAKRRRYKKSAEYGN